MEVIKQDSPIVEICYFPESQFLYVKLKENVEYSLENVIRVHELIHEIKKDAQIYILINLINAQFEHFPKESLEYLADNPYSKYQMKKALLISGLGQKLFSNFYLSIFKPKVKTRVFNKFKEALNWLEIDQSVELIVK